MFENFKKVRAIKKAINHTELSIIERSSIVNEVTTKCFVDNKYHSEYVKPMFTLSVLRMFTTISPIMMKNENGTDKEYVDVEKTYAYCVENHVMDYVIAKCKYMYIDDLYEECIEAIEFKKAQVLAQTTSLSDQVLNGFVEVLDSVKNAVNNFDMDKGQEVFDFIDKVNKSGATEKTIIDSIVKNATKKDNSNITHISPTTEG